VPRQSLPIQRWSAEPRAVQPCGAIRAIPAVRGGSKPRADTPCRSCVVRPCEAETSLGSASQSCVTRPRLAKAGPGMPPERCHVCCLSGALRSHSEQGEVVPFHRDSSSDDFKKPEAKARRCLGIRAPLTDSNLNADAGDDVDHVVLGQHPGVIFHVHCRPPVPIHGPTA
jgi:hypothetical protein